MNVILNYFIEANLGLVLFYAIYKLLLNEETSFSFNRTYLIGSILISLIFPLVTIGSGSPLPTMSAVIPPHYLPELVITAEGKAATEVDAVATQTLSFWAIIKWVYLTGFAFLLLRFILQVGKLVWRIQSHDFASIHGNGKIIETNTPHPTFSFFNYIFIGNLNELSEEEKDQIISHEMVHANKLHSIDILLIEFLRIVFWFNPLIKNYKHSIIMVHEFQADADTVSGGDSEKYCNLLARVALLSADFKLANQFTNSLTLKRIKMLNAMKKKISTWKLAVMIPVVAGFFFVVACQDQVISEMTDVAENSFIATEIPAEVQKKLDEMKAKYPSVKKFVVIEMNEEGKQTVYELQSKYGALENNFFMEIKDKDDHDKPRQFLITEFDENAKQVADLSKSEDVFTIVEETATYPGGMTEWHEFVAQNFQYPAQARRLGVEGKVFVQFVVEKDGSLGEFQVLKGIGAGCDAEAMRVMALSKPWNPAKQRGKIVRQRMVMPIIFKLSNNSSIADPDNAAIEFNQKGNEEGDIVFTQVQESATYPNGMSEFYEFVSNNINYPAKAKEMGIEGKVHIQFIVEKDGKLTDLIILKGIGAGCDEEAMRLLAQSKTWNPGKQGGKVVRQRMVIPINFKL